MRKTHRKPSTFILSLNLILCLGIFLSACGHETPPENQTLTATTAQTEIPVITPTPRPSPTPTLPPLGMEGNPVTIGFILSQEDFNRVAAAEDLAFLISENTGYAMESVIFPDFVSLAEAALEGGVDLFWTTPLQYLYLNEQSAADVLLMSNHLGVFAYGVQFLANHAYEFTSYYDPETAESQGDVIDSLQQFAGTRPCLLNPSSLPGYYVPMGLLAQASSPTLEPVFVYDYSAIIRALYVEGICDFGISYALIGDPRTAGDIIRDIPDAQEQVEVIWQTGGVIPNTSLSVSPNLPLTMQVRIQEAFLGLSNTTDGLPLISSALNYDIAAFKAVTDDFYTPLRLILAPLELDMAAITTQ